MEPNILLSLEDKTTLYLMNDKQNKEKMKMKAEFNINKKKN